MRVAQQDLLRLVRKVFEDGVVTAHERLELRNLYRQSGLTVREVKEVFTAFVKQTWGEALADDVFTDAECDKLVAIVRELRLTDDCIPPVVRVVVDARRQPRAAVT